MPEVFEEINIPQIGRSYKQPIGIFIDNEFVPSSNGEKIETINPATEEVITSFYAATEDDVDKAVKSARESYENVWFKISPAEKRDMLLKLADLIEEEKPLLAALETLDAGKPYHTNAMDDIDQIIHLTKYFAGATDKFTQGKTIPIDHEKLVYTLKSPYGVCGMIIPWNYPLAMASWKMQGCLAAGNTLVIKPAENTSLSLLYLAQLFKKAGFPKGVVNVVPGKGSVVGNSLGLHMDVDKISFTGSTKVGSSILELAGKSNMKDVTLECGGKSPAVVFQDADIDNAIEYIANGIFYNSGQNCTANSRVYVQEDIYDNFIKRFTEHTKENWKFGSKCDPFDKDCTVGPVVSEKQFETVNDYIRHGKEEENLQIHQTVEKCDCKGYFISPTIFTDVPQGSKLMKEEIFGPVVVVAKFKDYKEAIKLANDTNYGLASMVFTKNISVANWFARDIKSGTVWINSSNEEDPTAPFGGFKQSGIGRELGETGVESYMQIKTVHLNMSEKI